MSSAGLLTRGGGAGSGRDQIVRPFLLIGVLSVGLALLAARFAPQSVAGPLALAGTVAPLVLGFVWRPKAALLAFAIYMLFADTSALYLPSAVSYVDEISIPCFLVIALVRWRPISRARISPVRDGAVLALFAAGIASSLLHSVPFGVWVPEFALVAKGIAFFYIATWIEHRPEDLRAYAWVLGTVAVVVFAFGGLELLAPSVIPAIGLNPVDVSRVGLPSLKGPFVQPYHFGWFAAFVLSLAFGRFVVTRQRAALALGLVAFAAVILSARRWSIVAVLSGLAAGLLLYRASLRSWRESLRTWAPALAGTAILLVVFLPSILGLVQLAFTEYVDPAVQATQADSGENLRPRISLYVVSLEIARDDFPLGVGFGRFASFMSGQDYSPVYAQYGLSNDIGLSATDTRYITDTFWPQVIGEAGVIGFVGYAVFLASVGLTIWRFAVAELARAGRDTIIAAFAVGAAVAFAQCFVAAIANTMYNHPPEAFLTFGTFGVAVGLAWQRRAGTLTASARP